MLIPNSFPEDVKAKLTAVQAETNKNQASVEAFKKQLTTEDYRKAATLAGIESPKYSTKSTVAGVPGIADPETGFFSKYKYYIIGGVVLIAIVIGVYIYKKKR